MTPACFTSLSSLKLRCRNFCRTETARAFGVIIGIKSLIFLFAFIAYPLVSRKIPPTDIWDYLILLWNRWDALNYLQIASNWYVTNGPGENLIAFYPFFPLLIRSFSRIFSNLTAIAFIVANLASVLGLYAFYALARLDFNRRQSLTILCTLLLFPTAYFFNAPYTEGLFLLFAASSLYLARKRLWLSAVILAGVASLTRVLGLALFPALLIELCLQIRHRQTKWYNVFLLSVIPLIFSYYLYINHTITGSIFGFRAAIQSGWSKSFAWPWQSLWLTWQQVHPFPWSEYVLTNGVFELLAGLALLIACYFSFRKLRLTYTAFIAAATFIILSTSHLMSTPRYILSAFPVFLLAGFVRSSSWVGRGWIIISVLSLAVLLGEYISGWWAF